MLWFLRLLGAPADPDENMAWQYRHPARVAFAFATLLSAFFSAFLLASTQKPKLALASSSARSCSCLFWPMSARGSASHARGPKGTPQRVEPLEVSALYIVPFLIIAAAFCVSLVRTPLEPLRSIAQTRRGHAMATLWVVTALPVAALWLIHALSGPRSSTARLAECVIGGVIVAGFVKAIAVARSTGGAK
jgi:hypothetical protein